MQRSSSDRDCSVDLTRFEEDIELAIMLTLPDNPSDDRNLSRALHEFARHLKGIGEKAGAGSEDFEEWVEEWHRQTFPNSPPPDFQDIMVRFEELYDAVKIPYETHALVEAIKAARKHPVGFYRNRWKLDYLLGVCWVLQQQSGQGPFFISGKSAGQVLEATKETGRSYLNRLRKDGYLSLHRRGHSGKASEYICNLPSP